MGKRGVIPGSDLTLKQEKFCQLYASVQEFFGNGTQAYLEAFGYKGKGKGTSVARFEASKLLTNHHILNRINQLLDISLNEAMADKQLSMLVLQNSDLNVKLGALKHWNELKGRIVKKIQHSGGMLIGHVFKTLETIDKNDGIRPPKIEG